MARTLVNSVIIKPATTAQVGDVVQSMLTEVQFQAPRDSTWVLMDGRDLSVTNPGSAYETLTGQSVLPDARGQFLRGLDTSGTVDPDGAGRSLGNFQSDQVGPISGTGGNFSVYSSSGNQAAALAIFGSSPPWQKYAYTHNATNETRPKNITVNIFIKINE